MVFSSTVFLFAFFPVTFIIYKLLPSIKSQNIFLVIASLVFYAYGEPVYVLLMLCSVLANYLFGRLVTCSKARRFWMVTAVLANLGVLAIFKYSAFLVQNINATAHFSLPVPQMHFPVGISFFTFQALSYVIDVYREPDTCQKNFIKLLLYISLFPQLIAGPIVKYHDIAAEIDSRTVTAKETAEGLRRFFCGLAKKVLIADVLGLAVDKIYALPAADLCAASAWFAAVAYALQIYFDFSGYSDMAIGMGQMFGFHFKENFNHPYYADSIQDFWRRWHISLSAWFKEYLYFPLGGNRKGKARTVLNKYIVFFCTGLWHGANWTFVLWGLYHGTFAMLEQLNIIPVKKIRCRPVKQFYACLDRKSVV